MSNKCLFVVGQCYYKFLFRKYCKEAPPNFCLDCDYAWYSEIMESSDGLDVDGTLHCVRGDKE